MLKNSYITVGGLIEDINSEQNQNGRSKSDKYKGQFEQLGLIPRCFLGEIMSHSLQYWRQSICTSSETGHIPRWETSVLRICHGLKRSGDKKHYNYVLFPYSYDYQFWEAQLTLKLPAS